jgi:hypothetical protein
VWQGVVTSLASTGHLDDGVLVSGRYHAEYVFWTAEGSPYVYAQDLQSQESPTTEWQVFSSLNYQGQQYSLLKVAVSRWDDPQSQLYVAALVLIRQQQQQQLKMQVNTFQQGFWPSAQQQGGFNLTLYSGTQDIQVSNISHAKR